MARKIEWHYKIGDNIIKDKLNLTIINRRMNKNNQEYQVRCNKCGFNGGKHVSVYGKNKDLVQEEYWILYGNLKKMKECPCCGRRSTILVDGINDIPTTDSWMIPYFQGGEEEAKLYTHGNTKKIYPICPDCKRISDKPVVINHIYTNKNSFCACRKSISLPNKMIRFVMNQLSDYLIYYESEYQPNWGKPYFYDMFFVIRNKKYIIEMDGGFHYSNNSLSGLSMEEQKEIDRKKDELAINNDCIVIRINCNYDHYNCFKYIKNNIIKELKDILPLEKINWDNIENDCYKNINKYICELYNNNVSINNICKEVHFRYETVVRILQKGTLNGWCNFLTYKNVKDNNYNSFKSIIKENYKYSREELANKLGVSCTTINNYIKEFKNSNEFDWEYFKKYKIFNKDAILQLTKENNIIKR